MKYIQRKKKINNGYLQLQNLSNVSNLPVDVVAQKIVDQRRPEIDSYVSAAGLTPEENPAALATQAYLIHNDRIADAMQRFGIYDVEAGENFVLEQDAQSFDGNDHNAFNSFAPALLAVIAPVAKKGIEAINDKRIKNGKKPILSGKFWDFLKNKTELSADGSSLDVKLKGEPGEPSQSELAAGLRAAQAELEAQAKKDYLKKNLPLFIVIGVAVIAAIYFIVKKSK